MITPGQYSVWLKTPIGEGSGMERLSVAAITYYITGLFSYLAKATHDSRLLKLEPKYATALFIPSPRWPCGSR